MDLTALRRGEILATAGAILLGISLIMAWYTLGNRYVSLNGCGPHAPGSSCSGWNSLSGLRYVLILTAVAPLILSWIIVRGHALAWPRGEMTAVVAVVALVVTIFRGVIDKPGTIRSEVGLDYGWYVALVGSLLMLGGAAWRSKESGPQRKPPGVL